MAGTLGLLLAAIQVLPFLEYLRHGARSGAVGHQLFYEPGLFSLVVFPLLLGSPMQQYRNPALAEVTFSAVGIGYVGLAILFAAIVGAVSFLWTRRRLALFFALVSVTWFVLAYDAAGITSWLTSLPGIRELVIIRSNAVVLFSAAALAALGVDAAADRAGRARGRALTAAISGGALALAVAALGVAAFTFDRFPPLNGMREMARATARDHLVFVLGTFVLAAAAIVVLTVANGKTIRAVAAVGVLAAVFLQGGYLFRSWNPTVGDRFVYQRNDNLDAIAARVGDEQTLYEGAATLIPDINLKYRLRSPANYDVINVDVYAKLYRKVLRPPAPGRAGGAILEILAGPVRPEGIGGLRAMGIRYVVTGRDDRLALEGLEPVAEIGTFAVARVPGSPPRYFSPAGVRRVVDNAAALRLASRPGFEPLERSVVEGDPGDVANAVPSEQGQVEVLSETPTAIRLRVTRSTPGWVFAQQSAAPGWHATVDGRDLEIRRGNAAFLAVPVGRGTHEVVLRYRPTSVVVGAWISGAALVTILLIPIGGSFWSRRRQRRSSAAARPDRREAAST